jgi:transcriptional regulator with XRE-family HTH domain
MALVRQEVGDVLRVLRQQKGRTLRQISSRASVALGYLSEVERGQKEVSSEILASVAYALDVPVSKIMRLVAERLEAVESLQLSHTGFADEQVFIPDTVPADLVSSFDSQLAGSR